MSTHESKCTGRSCPCPFVSDRARTWPLAGGTAALSSTGACRARFRRLDFCPLGRTRTGTCCPSRTPARRSPDRHPTGDNGHKRRPSRTNALSPLVSSPTTPERTGG
jgi:hypothetical protein